MGPANEDAVPVIRATPANRLTPAVRAELLAPAAWKEPLAGYTRGTGLAVLMVTTDGTPLGPCINPQRIWTIVTDGVIPTGSCPFCLHPETVCTALDEARTSDAIAFGRDRSGLVHAVVPVRLAGESIAFLYAGQVFDRFPEQLLLEHLARATGRSGQILWDLARRELPIGRQQLQAYAALLSTLAESYVRAHHAGLVERRHYAEILGLHADLAEKREIEQVLREADRRKDEFLATLAHELRNPLAPMMTALHLLQHPSRSERTAARALSTLNRQLRHTVRLVDDLLDFSRITRGQIGLQLQRVPLADIVASAVETSRPEIEQRQHQLSVDEVPLRLLLDADPVRISQALSNLLTNAARYTEPGGTIRVTVREMDGDVAIAVADTGVGIAADLIDTVFEMFVRGEGANTAAPGGLGIGLTLAKMLVEMHGGSIAVRSEGRNQGSEFTIRLPLVVSATTPVATDDRVASPVLPEAGPSRRILLVEDNDDSREMLEQALLLKGHQVRSVGDGHAAIAAARAWRPDVVILDIGLPGMTGYDLARRLREQPELREVALVALTGWGQEKDRRQSSEAGIEHHLTKPLDPDRLDDLLVGLLRS